MDRINVPVADEVALVEDGAVGAEEAVLGEAAGAVGCAHVESLALGVSISVVTYKTINQKMHDIAVMVVASVNVNGHAYRLQPVRRKKMRCREPQQGWDNLLQGCQGQTPKASRDPDGHRA